MTYDTTRFPPSFGLILLTLCVQTNCILTFPRSALSSSGRSFLSGRFPVHGGTGQAMACSNWLPLNFTLLSGKLWQAGFANHFIGKGHLGYQTTDHLPINRGFDSHVGCKDLAPRPPYDSPYDSPWPPTASRLSPTATA